MANARKATTTVAKEVVETKPEVVDSRVDVFVPRDSGNSEPVFISLNGVNYRLPRGKSSKVPKAIAEMYMQMCEAQEQFYERHNAET